MASRESLMQILAIGHDTSMRGAGLSMREALARAAYSSHRGSLNVEDLLAVIKVDPRYVDQWCAYSEDKRTSTGWYLLREGEVGEIGVSASIACFESIEEATAIYVLRELDYWAGVGEPASNRLHRPRFARR